MTKWEINRVGNFLYLWAGPHSGLFSLSLWVKFFCTSWNHIEESHKSTSYPQNISPHLGLIKVGWHLNPLVFTSSGQVVISTWMSHYDLKFYMFMKKLIITCEKKTWLPFLDFSFLLLLSHLCGHFSLIHSSPAPSISSQILPMFPIKYT